MKNKFFLFSVALCLCMAAFAEQMPSTYYDGIDGKQDSILKGTLKTIIRDHTVIPYGSGTNSSWEVFYYADQNEEGYCMDMYCDDWKKFTSPGVVVSGCNVEHSFAKSWWGGAKNDAYKDCYHLNPSNSTANSARSNYPLGVPVKDFKSNSGSLKVGKIHHDSLDVDFYVFEPKDEYKGDFARAYFYMVTCYGKDMNGNYDATICSAYNVWITKMWVRVSLCRTITTWSSSLGNKRCSLHGIVPTRYPSKKLIVPMRSAISSTTVILLSTIRISPNISGERKQDNRSI